MYRYLFAAIVLLLYAAAMVAAAENVPPATRVANHPNYGVCYWACAETIGRVHGIQPLFGLRDRVITNGYGRDGGATEDAIRYWFAETDTAVVHTSVKDSVLLGEMVHKDLYPIVTMFNWQDTGRHKTHAVVVLGFEAKKQFLDHRNVLRDDSAVVAYDPNHPDQRSLISWTWFWLHWSGRMSCITPGAKAKPTDRLMLATMQMPAPKTGVPTVEFPTQSTYTVRGLLQPAEIQRPANIVTTDLGDGIQRPLDTILDASYRTGQSRNYYIPQPSP